MLTNAAIKAAQPGARPYKMFDAGGLFLFVAPTGLKSWRMKYRFDGREKLLTLGRWPGVSLADARLEREAAKARLRAGADPAGGRLAGDSFEQLARAWHAHHGANWSTVHAADVLASLERDVFPAIGATGVDAITPAQVLGLLREVEARGCVATARRLRHRVSAVFRFGIAQGQASHDPAEKLAAAMRPQPLARPMPALIAIEECRALLAACESSGVRNRAMLLASRFLALTAVRLDAVRGCRWEEFSDLDGEAPLWTVPPERMKLGQLKKADAAFAHAVPLSPQAVRVLREAREIGCDTRSLLVFPGRGGAAAGEGALRQLYERAGFAGRHVPHGWRASFSTIMNEAMGPEWRDDIDRALAHSPKDKVEAAYNRAQQLERRRALFERWGEMLAG